MPLNVLARGDEVINEAAHVAISVGIALWNTMAVAADVKVLSAGAVEPGLLRAAEQFERASGNRLGIIPYRAATLKPALTT